MATIVKDLGAVTAYAYAKEKGYTGTEDEFAELMASYADVAEQAAESASAAAASERNAQTYSQTAVDKALEASGYATTATNKASEAATSASSASGSAATATQKASDASASATAAGNSANAAAGSATDAYNSASAAASSATAASNAQTAAETAQGKAEDAQEEAEAAASSLSASAAQIATNAADISDLKSALTLINGGDFTIVNDYYINASGGRSSGSTLCYLDYYPIVPDGYVHVETYMAAGMAIAFYDKNKTYISGSSINNADGDIGTLFVRDIHCPEVAHFIRVSCNKATVSGLKVISMLTESIPYKNSQLENDSGYLVDSDLDYLDNRVEDISELKQSKNLWDYSATVVGQLDSNYGTVNVTQTDYVTTDFIPYHSGENFYLYYLNYGALTAVTPSGSNGAKMCLYGAGKNHLGTIIGSQFGTPPETIPTYSEAVEYIRFTFVKSFWSNANRQYGIFKSAITNEAQFDTYYRYYVTPEQKKDYALIAYGDSLTAGTGSTDSAHRYLNQCMTALGAKDCSPFGYGGSGSKAIAFTAGALSAYVPPNTRSFSLKYADMSTDVSIALNQLNGKKVLIDGFQYDISQTGATAYSLPNSYTPAAYYKPVITKDSKATADVYVIWIGTNDNGYQWDVIDAMIAKLPHHQYVVMGLTRLGTDTTVANEQKAYEKYGSHFFNTRVQIINNAFAVLGMTPTAEDTTAMNDGLMPPSLLSDAIHFNDDGYEAIGKLLAEHIQSLGYDYQKA